MRGDARATSPDHPAVAHEFRDSPNEKQELKPTSYQGAQPGVTANPFVGDRVTSSSKPYLARGSLHIRQSRDGTLLTWLDRVIGSSDRRNGELLQVHTASASELELETTGPGGPSYRYHVRLSADGQMLTGEWADNDGARLNAFRAISESA